MSQVPFPRLPTIPFPPVTGGSKSGWNPAGTGSAIHGMSSMNAGTNNPMSALSNGVGGYNPTNSNVKTTSAQRQAELRELIEKERMIKMGSENLLEALNGNKSKTKAVRGQRQMVEAELQTSTRRLEELRQGLEEEIQRADMTAIADSNNIALSGSGTLDGSTIMGTGSAAGSTGALKMKEESPSIVLSGLMQAIGVESMAPEYYIDLANRLADLFKTHPAARFEVSWPIFGPRMQTLILSPKREVVAAGYRTIRSSITDRRSLQILRGYRLDVPIVSSLGQTRAVVEREQALKLVRAFVDVPDGVWELEPAIVNVVVAIADQAEDRLRGLAVLTVAEMVVRDVRVVRRSRGLAVLANAVGAGFMGAGLAVEKEVESSGPGYSSAGGYAIGPVDGLASALLHAYDTNRDGGRAGLEGAIAVFAEGSEAEPSGLLGRVAGAVKVATAALRTWPGLVSMAGEGAGGIRALIAGLGAEEQVVNGTLDVVVDVLGLAHDGGEVTEKRASGFQDDDDEEVEPIRLDFEEEEDDISNALIFQYRSLVLAVLVKAGMVPGLVRAWRRSKGDIKRRILKLIVSAQRRTALLGISAEPDADSECHDIGRDGGRFVESDMKSGLYGTDLVYAIAAAQPQPSHLLGKRPRPDPPDEAAFRQQMLDTGVLSTRNPSKWRWDTIEQVIHGPLRSAARLDEALKTSRFVGRLLSFYRPFNGRFSTLSNSPSNQRYVHAGCGLVRALLRHPSGVRTLADSKLIRQLAECIAQFDPSSGIVSSRPLFSSDRISDTLVCGYFDLIGAMSSRRAGVAVLARWRVWNMLLHVVGRPDRSDLTEGILAALDYRLDSPARVVLARVLSGSHTSVSTRVFATGMLRPHAIRPNAAREWALGLLLVQLYDPDLPVCEKAVGILAEACTHSDALAAVVARRPSLDHLGELAAPLLLRFLATSDGYGYLQQLDYVARQMEDWFLGRNEEYVAVVEGVLHLRLMSQFEKESTDAYSGMAGNNVNPTVHDVGWPPHFYRELVRTPDGCDLLQSKSHFSAFCKTITAASGLPLLPSPDALYSHPTPDSLDPSLVAACVYPSTVLKLKAALWAVGNIGSTHLGAPFLDDAGVVPHIVCIAKIHPVLSIRGTAFYVLALIGRSELGAEMLRMARWEGLSLGGAGGVGDIGPGGVTVSASAGKTDKPGSPTTGFPLFDGPVRVRSDTTTSLPPTPTAVARPTTSASANELSRSPAGTSAFPTLPPATGSCPGTLANSATADLVLRTIASLGSFLTSKRAAARLQSLRKEHPRLFESPDMWRRVNAMMGAYHFRLPAVRFLVEGFTGWRGVVMDLAEDPPPVESNRDRAGSKDSRNKQYQHGNVHRNNPNNYPSAATESIPFAAVRPMVEKEQYRAAGGQHYQGQDQNEQPFR